MMSPYDFDNLASLAKDRHTEMMAEAKEQRMLNEASPANPQEHGVWQWVHRTFVDQMQHIHLHRPAMTRHSVQHH